MQRGVICWVPVIKSLTLTALVVTLAGEAAEAQVRSASRPNIILVYPDDHAEQAISAYGSKINRTPNIDRIAEEGMLFRNSFVTNSICAPARAVVLTGKHSHLNGVFDNRQIFDPTQPTFPRLLQEAGYQTVIIGKWHLESEPVGFDYWKILPGQGHYYNPDFLTAEGSVQHTGYVTDIITDETLDWLQHQRDPNRPFLLLYQHKDAHRPWSPGSAYLPLYSGEEIPEPRTLFDDHSGRASGAHAAAMTIARHLHPSYDLKLPFGEYGDVLDRAARTIYERMNEEQQAIWDATYGPKNEAAARLKLEGRDRVRFNYQRYIKDYLRTVAALDHNVGRLLQYLDEAGLAEHTIVVYSSDQGFFLGEKGWYDKRWMYEESLRTPLIVRWPGVVQPGSQSHELVQNLDVAQTFLEMAGVAAPAEMQGRSLVPLLEGRTPADWRTSIYYHYYEYPDAHKVPRHYGLRTQRYKLMHYYQLGEWELFDLQEDPDEQRSLYTDPAYSGVRQELEVELARLRKHYRVPEVDPDPDANARPRQGASAQLKRRDETAGAAENIQPAPGLPATARLGNTIGAFEQRSDDWRSPWLRRSSARCPPSGNFGPATSRCRTMAIRSGSATSASGGPSVLGQPNAPTRERSQ